MYFDEEKDPAAKYAREKADQLLVELTNKLSVEAGVRVKNGILYNPIFTAFYNSYKPEPDKQVLQGELVDLMRCDNYPLQTWEQITRGKGLGISRVLNPFEP